MTGSSGKTLSGPQGGVIVWNDHELTEPLRSTIFPVIAATHMVNRVAALAVAAAEMITFGRVYMAQIVKNAQALGAALANEAPVDADYVMPFPDSGNYAAIGYSQASGIPLEMGMIRNHYVGRTFIQPSQAMRDFSVRVKLNPVRSLLKGKRVIIVEDSIIRGTTGRSRVRALRDVGAKEIHMLVSCPPTRNACYYGIDFPSSTELIASQKSLDGIRDHLGLDSPTYLRLGGLVEATGLPREDFCLACFDGNYPIAPDTSFTKNSLSGCGCQGNGTRFTV